MRTKMIQVFPETALERIVAALERELVEATDEEILAAAHELGMQPQMKGSAAFLGLRYPTVRLSGELTIAAARAARRQLDLRGQAARAEAPAGRPTGRRPPVKSSRDED